VAVRMKVGRVRLRTIWLRRCEFSTRRGGFFAHGSERVRAGNELEAPSADVHETDGRAG